MPRPRKTTEHQIVYNTRWQGGTVLNDAHNLQHKGIKSPEPIGLFAMARSRDGKTTVWLKSPERVSVLKENPLTKDYIIEIINNN